MLQDPITEEVKYIGKSNNPKRRYQSHLWDRPKVKYYSYYWIRYLLKKDLRPIMTIIDETEGDWELLEKYWIGQMKAWGFKLCNITDGGNGAYGAGKWNNKQISAYDIQGNYIDTFESIKLAASIYKVNYKQIENILKCRGKLCHNTQFRYGDNKENIGKPILREVDHNGIIQINKEGYIENEYLSAKDAANKLKVSHGNIYQCLNNKRKTAYGYKWKYK